MTVTRRSRRRDRKNKIKDLFAKIGTINIVLILVGAFFVWFNWQMLVTFRECGSIPETYACSVVAATIGECGICGWIRTTKDRKRERIWEEEDKKESQMQNDEHDIEIQNVDL